MSNTPTQTDPTALVAEVRSALAKLPGSASWAWGLTHRELTRLPTWLTRLCDLVTAQQAQIDALRGQLTEADKEVQRLQITLDHTQGGIAL